MAPRFPAVLQRVMSVYQALGVPGGPDPVSCPLVELRGKVGPAWNSQAPLHAPREGTTESRGCRARAILLCVPAAGAPGPRAPRRQGQALRVRWWWSLLFDPYGVQAPGSAGPCGTSQREGGFLASGSRTGVAGSPRPTSSTCWMLGPGLQGEDEL